ncbi:hypothetical protein [uncultured Mediterranean phage]|nr:hypothetical protein [uncultured Mediterranean phage]
MLAIYPYFQDTYYDFVVRIAKDADTSNLIIYTVTNDSKSYTILATSYEEALTVAGFIGSETTKTSEEPY